MSRKVPKYRRRCDGLGFVEHASIPNKSHRKTLGKYGSEESIQRYREFLAQLQGARGSVYVAGQFLLVREIRDAYFDFAEQHYRRYGDVSGEYTGMTYALAALDDFADLPSSQFGPRCLVAIRTALAQAGYVRSTVNHMLSRIKKMFRWACENELCPSELYHKLTSVRGLVRGELGCRESIPVPPALTTSIDGILPFVSTTVRAMILTQYRTGMRPDEVCRMRLDAIDRSRQTWLYVPEHHKNSHRGLPMFKALTPSVQAILRPFLVNNPYMFLPRRKRERYFPETYRRAIEYGFTKAKKAGVELEPFTPNQLRHAIATRVAQKHGHRAAQVLCWHEQPATTSIYIQNQIQELVTIAESLEADWTKSA